MQDRTEAGTTGNDEVTRAKAEVNQEIDEARAKPTATEVSVAELALAQKLLKELTEKATAAREVRGVDKATQGLGVSAKSKEAVSVKVTLVKVLEAVKMGVIPAQPKTKAVLMELAERAGRITDTSASYLQPILERYINKDITFSKIGQEPTRFEKDFRQLKTDNPIAAEILGQILYDKAGELGDITKDDLKSQLEVDTDEEGKIKIPEEKESEEERRKKAEEELRRVQEDVARRRGRREDETPEGREDIIEIIKERQFDLYLTDNDKEFLKAIYFPTEFIKYIEDEKEKAKAEGRATDDAKAYELASKAVEEKLIEVLDKILTRFSETNPERYFTEVASENFLQGIQTTLAALGS